MASVVIGGKNYQIAELKFKALKAAWPHIKRNQELARGLGEGEEMDPIESMENAIAIISAGLVADHPELTPEGIEERITTNECKALDVTIVDIMVESGFMQRTPTGQGEAEPEEGAAASPSTETSTD